MQAIDKPTCSICLDEYAPSNPPIYEPVGKHHFHQECWNGWVQENHRPVRECTCLEFLFAECCFPFNPNEPNYTSCPICRTWVRTDELKKEGELVQRDAIEEPRKQYSLLQLIVLIVIVVVAIIWFIVHALMGVFFPCIECPQFLDLLY